MELFFQNLMFTVNNIAPIFLMVFLGIVLKRKGMINENFVTVASKVVFSVTIPALIFMEIIDVDLSRAVNFEQIGYIYGGVLFLFALGWLFALFFISEGRDRGVFIQGSFRSNFAIVGLAIIANMSGESALAKSAVILAFIIPFYNVLSVLALTLPMQKEKHLNWQSLLLEIIKNPLIIGLLAALPFAYLSIPIPEVFRKTGNYLAAVTLPLALLGIGGSLNFSSMKNSSRNVFSATFIKLVLSPAAVTPAGYLLGFRGDDLAILFVLFASPTAVVSFIMAEAMGGNARLAGDIILYSTLGSVITISAGIFMMKAAGLF